MQAAKIKVAVFQYPSALSPDLQSGQLSKGQPSVPGLGVNQPRHFYLDVPTVPALCRSAARHHCGAGHGVNRHVALDRICIVPLMFRVLYAALARWSGHAKVTAAPGRHARSRLAAVARNAYFLELPALPTTV